MVCKKISNLFINYCITKGKNLFLKKFLSIVPATYTFAFILITILSFSQNTDPDYFDQDWEKISKEKASFY